MSKNTPQSPSRIYRLKDVKCLTGLSRSTIYIQMAEGKFPKQVKLGARAVGWREADISVWLENREAV